MGNRRSGDFSVLFRGEEVVGEFMGMDSAELMSQALDGDLLYMVSARYLTSSVYLLRDGKWCRQSSALAEGYSVLTTIWLSR